MGGKADHLFEVLYDELKRIADRVLLYGEKNAMQATALVHEAYFKLAGSTEAKWNDQSHFRAIAACAMRQVLVDCARARGRAKRGGGAVALSLDTTVLGGECAAADALGLEELVHELETEMPRAGEVVTMRFFGGMTIEETARRLDLSTATVEREWRFARAWLYDRLFGAETGDTATRGRESTA